MDLIGFWKKLTTGKVIFETTSPINGKIQVVEDIFGRRLLVKGLTQSGGQVKRIWKEAINQVSSIKYQVSSILILGLGAGTLAQLVSQKWPKAEVIGVEIDQKIIEAGKKYFNLDKIPNLQIVISDAVQYIQKFSIFHLLFSIIFVDLYLGDQVPRQTEEGEFLRSLKKILAPNGLLVFNRLYYKEHREKTEIFLDKLEKIFQNIRKKKIGSNLLIFAGGKL